MAVAKEQIRQIISENNISNQGLVRLLWKTSIRPFFLKDRSLLNCLFIAVRSVLLTEGMTAKLVRNMTEPDLLDMHYFLTEDDDLDDEFEEGFYIF